MTTYIFNGESSGDWSDQSLWFNTDSSMINDGTPGAGDTAEIYADIDTTTTVTTAGETVGTVDGDGQGTNVLTGSGLNVTGTMLQITLSGGDYTVSGSALSVTLLGGTLSGNAIGGTLATQGGVDVEGGEVTNSASFRGSVSGLGKVHTVELLGGSTSDSGQIFATTTGSSASISENDGLIQLGSVALGPNGGGTVRGGTFTDEGDFSLQGSSLSALAVLTFSGGTATVAGAAAVDEFSYLNVTGMGNLTLAQGLTLGKDSGGVANLGVGSPGNAGGTLTITAGAVVVGGQGDAKVNVSTGGLLSALSSNIQIAKSSSSNSSITVANGSKLRALSMNVGKGGEGALNISSGGRVNLSSGLIVGGGMTSTIAISGAGSKLNVLGSVTVGGTATASGGMDSKITIGAGASATLGATTIWNETGELVDSGTLTFTGDVHGVAGAVNQPDQLKIESGAIVNMQGAASHMKIDFDGAGTLNLGDPNGFSATINGTSSGGKIVVASFLGAAESFVENAAGTLGTVYLMGSTTVALNVLGDHAPTDFHWNASTGTLKFV